MLCIASCKAIIAHFSRSIVVLYCRCIGATNKALAKRRAAEDALRIIAEKEAAVAAAAVAQQASKLQAAIGISAHKEMVTDHTAADKDKVVDNAAAQEDMAVDNAPPPAKTSGQGEMLATPDTPTQS